jgi:hypothetical protein
MSLESPTIVTITPRRSTRLLSEKIMLADVDIGVPEPSPEAELDEVSSSVFASCTSPPAERQNFAARSGSRPKSASSTRTTAQSQSLERMRVVTVHSTKALTIPVTPLSHLAQRLGAKHYSTMGSSSTTVQPPSIAGPRPNEPTSTVENVTAMIPKASRARPASAPPKR